MIKRTLYFGNPFYIYTHLEQMCWQAIDEKLNANNITEINNIVITTPPLPNEADDEFMQGIIDKHNLAKPSTTYQQTKYEAPKDTSGGRAAIEDIGVVIIDHAQIAISHTLINKLLANNVALITCDATHHPTGLLFNLDGNTLQSQRFQYQINASQPLKKQLWRQTIQCKIQNQANLLTKQQVQAGNMHKWVQDVKSGDSKNHEAQAAVYYWKHIFTTLPDFTRARDGQAPNNILNYGYAILRAIVARSLVGSGLLPTLGIFHRNQYNAYCLADDIMEPYRPFVDQLALQIIAQYGLVETISKPIKAMLLNIPTVDVSIDGQSSPLMVAVQRTTASLVKCFEGSVRKITYPNL
jgi:CRISP-associated protein Cas1